MAGSRPHSRRTMAMYSASNERIFWFPKETRQYNARTRKVVCFY